MKRTICNRVLASFLAVAMTGTMIPGVTLAKESKETALAEFTFDDVETGFASEKAKAQIKGSYRLDESKDSESKNALYLDGNAGNYLSVTDLNGGSLLSGKKELTISYDEKPDRTGTNWAFYAAPDDKAQTNQKEHYIGAFHNNGKIKVERYNNTGSRPASIEKNTGTDWAHVDIVFREDETELYVDGVKTSELESDYAIGDILGDSGVFYIGRANWGSGEGYKGWIDNFKIYDKALEESELVSETAAREAVAADKEALTLPEIVTESFVLPEKGANYSKITWTVEESDVVVIGEDGYHVQVTRPEGNDAEIMFTASIEMAGIKETKEFSVKVKKVLEDDKLLEAAKDALELVGTEDVRTNIYLPETVEIEDAGRTASVTWQSSNEAVVTSKEENGKPAGVVTRQEKEEKVTLTATITAGVEHTTKKFELTVKKAPKMEEKTDYLFAYFVNNGGPAEQQIFYASSRDGDNWMDLNKKEAVLSVADSVRTEEDIANTRNQAGVRDPYLIRSAEGDKFFLIATDLCIGEENIAGGTVGWGTAQYNGSHYLRIWESNDLVNWSEPWLAEVAPKGTTCAWAPEAIYDESTGEFVIYWASMTGSVQKVYASKTRDFKHFSEPQLFIDNGNDHIIDTTIVRDSVGNYYRGSAAGGTIQLEKCTDANEWLTNQSAWTKQGNIKEITGFTAGLEGPELFAYNQDDWKQVDGKQVETYGLLADNYGGVGYVPFYTTDIANAKWVKTADENFNFDTLHKRHGTVLALTADEYSKIMEAYGPKEITVKKAPTVTEYEVGAKKLNAEGLVLEVTYANGKTEEISYHAGSKNARQFAFGEADFTKEGTQEITVTYGERQTAFTIQVVKAQEIEEKILAAFDFDDETEGFQSEYAKAEGTYALQDSYDTTAGKALYLNGTASNFLTVKAMDGGSLLTGAKELTISYEAKTDRSSTNWVMYAAPNDKAPVYNSETYIGVMENSGSTKLERYQNKGTRPACASAVTGSDWVHVDIVLTAYDTTIYVNGVKQQTVDSDYTIPNILGENSVLQIGKANWGSGEFYKGWIDNFTIRNKALDAASVKELSKDFLKTRPIVSNVTVGSEPDRETALEYRGTDDHTAVFTKIDTEAKEIISYVRDEADITSIPVTFTFHGEAEIESDGKLIKNGSKWDLSEDRSVILRTDDKEEIWTIREPVLSNNPVLPGQYADPDIDYLDGKFWLFPTTDGYPGWSGTKFHAFSSEDMVNWTDEGVILELKNDNPGKNENGIQIAASPWAKGGSAWAPTIEEKNGKYYFYYCGKFSGGQSAIGVAVADSPEGPYVDKGEALMTVDMCKQAGVSMGQAIDPSIFTDEDGTSYLLFGNGSAAIAQLNDDMMSIKDGTLKQINGLTDFRESVVVTRANGKYHWTWSCDDANSPNYHVNYGVSDKLINEDGSASVTLVKKNLLSKDESKGILGSAHQSVLNVQDGFGQERYFMAYHRFYTPLNIFTAGDGLGVHRETCIDEITFDENGYMQITPTLEGVGAVDMTPEEPTIPEGTKVVAKYDMSHSDGMLTDVSGNKNHAKLVGLEESDFVEEDGRTVLQLPGDPNKYIELPANLIEKEVFVIEAEFKAEKAENSWLFCLGSKVDKWPNVKNYAFFCPAQGNNNNGKQGNIRSGIKDASNEILLGENQKINLGVYNTVTYEFRKGKVTVSLNGQEIESKDTGYSIQSILKDGTDGKISGYIGKSLYSPDPAFYGSLKSFRIYAEKKDHSDAGKVAEAKESLTLPYNTTDRKVSGNITLPKETENGVSVTWETDHPEIVDVKAYENKDYDATPAGTVTRPKKDTEVTMTAVLKCGKVTDTKSFTFTVKKAAKKLTEEDYKGYFFSYFAGEGYSDGEQIYFAASKDGMKWYDLNDNKPVLTSDQGEKGVRDPFIIRSPEGDKFYMIATDLKINGGNGWGAAQTAGSQSLMVWESEDLVNWSDMRMVEVSASIEAGCTWAPEASYDPITGEYIVYWASKVSSDNYGKQRVYYAKTRDFYTFTEPKLYIEKDESSIDTTIIYNEADQMYYRYTKNEGGNTNENGAKTKTIFAEKSKTLLGTWEQIPSDSLNANQWVEGPTIFRFNKQDAPNGKWCLLVDEFGGRGYYPLVSEDLSTGVFETPDSYLMPTRARHGTPIPVTEEEYRAVMAKWGTAFAQENTEEEQIAPVLEYDFEDAKDSEITDVSGNENHGTLNGAARVQRDEAKDSNVLYLDGSNETYIAFPQGFFDGRNTFSITMDMKAEKVAGNFFALAIGQDEKEYLFMRPTADAFKAVITKMTYKGEEGFTEKAGTAIENEWLHLTLIVDGRDMKLYLGDALIGHNPDVKYEMEELGENLLAYLGKSFYSNDGYFKGAFDNIKVYNRVLREVEISGGELGDKTELQQLLEQYKTVDETKYTKETYKVFAEAYAAAQAVNDNPDALKEDVENAVSELKKAYEALEEISEQPTDPEEPTNPEQPTDPEEPTNPQQPTDPEQPTDVQRPTETPEQKEADQAVNTGDMTNWDAVLMCIAAAAVLGVLSQRKKSEEE